ncbi:MAG: sodium:solute symporter family protein [Acidobacteriaceae bacterium]|nr:sodium:solute symporter family protein [Acidobacteriaceae bacterium]MBV9500323.1 sodium:solute symporter family protein [Acidobacteriaceae bacterium]
MIYITTLASVILLLCGITAYKARQVRSKVDFLVAGRTLSWPVLVFTLLSSWIGAGSLLAGAENAYKNGFVALWQPLGGWLGLVLIALIAGRVRHLAQFTIPDLLEARYNSTARVLATVAIVISYTIITSYQFIGGGDILHLIFPELARRTGLYIMAGFVIFFTAGAGMASIAYLDLVIGSMVTLTVIVAVPILLFRVGGWATVIHALPATHFEVLGNYSFAGALALALPTLLLLVGNQGMYQKFFSARSESDARKSVIGWIIGTVTLETLLVAVAVIASAKLRTDRPREIIPLTAREALPPLLGAILLGGVFAKVVSTANNYLFSPATNLIHDVYERFIDKNASQRRILIVSRLLVIVLGLFAVLQATQFESVLKASLYAYTVYGAAVTPAVMAVFFWRRTTTAAAISSILLGTVVTVVWEMIQQHGPATLQGKIASIDAVYPALLTSVASLILVSLATTAPAAAKLKQFESA